MLLDSKIVKTHTSIDLSEARERTDIALSVRKLLLVIFLASTFFLNVDCGILAPALLKMEEDLGVSARGLAILNGVTFVLAGILPMFLGPMMSYF